MDPSTQSLMRVHGVVLNAVTQAPIPRALVISVDRQMALLTDEKGRFEFDVNLLAAHAPQAGVPGEDAAYVTVKKPGYHAQGQPTQLPLDDPATLKSELRLQLMPEGTIGGDVTGSADEVPLGLSVQLLRRQIQDGRAVWVTAENREPDVRGRYRFGGLMPGNYKVVTAEWVDRVEPIGAAGGKPMMGYPPQAFPQGTTRAAAEVIRLSGGQNVEADISLRAASYYPVQIPVVSNPPVKFAEVAVATASGPGYGLGFNMRTQQVEGALPDGVYHVTVSGMGEAPQPNTVSNLLAGSVDLVVAGKPAHGARITLLPGITIPVNLSEEYTGPEPVSQGGVPEAAAPLEGVSAPLGQQAPLNDLPTPNARDVAQGPQTQVFLGPVDSEAQGRISGMGGFVSAQPEESGRGVLILRNVLPGRYHVQVNPRRGYVASITASGVDLLRDPLVLEPGGAAPEIAVVVRDDFGTVSGTISGEPGGGFASLIPSTVQAFPLGDDPAAQPVFGLVQPDGKFLLSNVVPGRYLVLAFKGQPPGLEFRNRDAMKAYESGGSIVEVLPGQTVSVAAKQVTPDPDYDSVEED